MINIYTQDGQRQSWHLSETLRSSLTVTPRLKINNEIRQNSSNCLSSTDSDATLDFWLQPFILRGRKSKKQSMKEGSEEKFLTLIQTVNPSQMYISTKKCALL